MSLYCCKSGLVVFEGKAHPSVKYDEVSVYEQGQRGVLPLAQKLCINIKVPWEFPATKTHSRASLFEKLRAQ